MGAPPTSLSPTNRSALKRRSYYRLSLCPHLAPNRTVDIHLDRLGLLALFDRNSRPLSCLFDVLLAVLVAFLASLLLRRGLFVDFSLPIFCFVVAGCQFSLLKSVQPDVSSPVHGYNWLVAYSRPAYFCLLAVILFLFDGDWWDHSIARRSLDWAWNPYRLTSAVFEAKMGAVRDCLASALLLLPLASTFGLLPQMNTFLVHLCEQIDMHLFGGTASFGVMSSLFALGRSLLTLSILVLLGHLTLQWTAEYGRVALSAVFFSVLTSAAYLLSRSSSNPALISRRKDDDNESADPLLLSTFVCRLKHDILLSFAGGFVMFGLHCSSVFSAAQPCLHHFLVIIAVVVGVINHQLIPQLRRHTPWAIVSKPVLKSAEFHQFETVVQARVMSFERMLILFRSVERNVVYPLLIVGDLIHFGPGISPKWLTPWLYPLLGLRLLRGGFSHPHMMHIPLLLSAGLVRFDLVRFPVGDYFPLFFYTLVVVWPKVLELRLKLQFILSYEAPWQISWGSSFHAFAHPFSIPHSAFTLMQAVVSSVISAPLNPFLGSSFFVTSYVRPVKFWEKNYNTGRVDYSNTRLATQIDRGPLLDDSNLNAVFYEHLSRSLQKSLAGDLQLGRWATSVQTGDCFILASFYLNCMVHIVELGNGFVTFQLRGLEFRGTYCHQREVEAINEDIADGQGCCCCEPGSLPGLLSLNTAWTLRWLSWEVTTAKYILEGYSITDNSAVNLLQVHELRRLLVSLYVKSIIYYAVLSPKLEEWLCMDTVLAALEPITSNAQFVDLDPMFCTANDEDYDLRLMVNKGRWK